MSQIQSYDESVAQSAHAEVQGVVSGLESSLDELGGFVNSVKSAWDGDEMDQYASVQANWDKCASTVKQILQQVHTALGSNTESVTAMRSKVKGTLSTSAG